MTGNQPLSGSPSRVFFLYQQLFTRRLDSAPCGVIHDGAVHYPGATINYWVRHIGRPCCARQMSATTMRLRSVDRDDERNCKKRKEIPCLVQLAVVPASSGTSVRELHPLPERVTNTATRLDVAEETTMLWARCQVMFV